MEYSKALDKTLTVDAPLEAKTKEFLELQIEYLKLKGRVAELEAGLQPMVRNRFPESTIIDIPLCQCN